MCVSVRQRSAARIFTCSSAAGGGETAHCQRPAAVASLVSSGTGHAPMSIDGFPIVQLLTAVIRMLPAPVCSYCSIRYFVSFMYLITNELRLYILLAKLAFNNELCETCYGVNSFIVINSG